LILGHNGEDFWEIPESIMGKFLSIIDADLIKIKYAATDILLHYTAQNYMNIYEYNHSNTS